LRTGDTYEKSATSADDGSRIATGCGGVIYPEWRGDDYIMVGDEIVVIDPRTHEIVGILEA
jgi:hypothetical protein